MQPTGGISLSVPTGTQYVDVGTLNPGRRVKVVLEFSVPPSAGRRFDIQYTPRILTGGTGVR